MYKHTPLLLCRLTMPLQILILVLMFASYCMLVVEGGGEPCGAEEKRTKVFVMVQYSSTVKVGPSGE